jgi:Domain of unknown function (DUF4376)
MDIFNPRDWYWQIATNSNAVYSSKRNVYVDPATDSNYAAWQTTNGGIAPPQVADESVVWYYVQNFIPPWMWNGTVMSQPAVGQYTKAQLSGYNADARWRRRNVGVIITSLSPVAFMSDDASVNDVNSSYNYGQFNQAATFNWKMSDGSFVTLNATQITTVHNDVLNFVQACFAQEHTNLTAINNGTLTTIANIDTSFAAVTNIYP